MFVKLFTRDLNVLNAIVQFMHLRKVLLDYSAPIAEQGGFTQLVRFKGDEATLTSLLRPRFKKNFAIIK